MLPLSAVLRVDAPLLDSRRTARRMLSLDVPVEVSAEATEALIHNISETGLLIETALAVDVGEALHVDLPHVGPTRARVVWTHDQLVGCEFLSPISPAAISAALLRNPFQSTAGAEAAPAVNFIVAHVVVSERRDDLPRGQTILIVSLLSALVAVLAFIIALLTFPFSV